MSEELAQRIRAVLEEHRFRYFGGVCVCGWKSAHPVGAEDYRAHLAEKLTEALSSPRALS